MVALDVEVIAHSGWLLQLIFKSKKMNLNQVAIHLP